jgi:hypothetical protein
MIDETYHQMMVASIAMQAALAPIHDGQPAGTARGMMSETARGM